MDLKTDWWKLLLVLIAVVALPWSIFASFSGSGLPQSEYTHLIDIESGELFRVRQRGHTHLIPMEHPDTGERSLFPSSRDEESGEWRLSTRYLPESPEDGGFEDWGAVQNPDTGEVRVPNPDDPRTLKID